MVPADGDELGDALGEIEGDARGKVEGDVLGEVEGDSGATLRAANWDSC